jgi:uncharacterized repeat protein (TIGR03803 family)
MKHRIEILTLLLGLAACGRPALQPALPGNAHVAPSARRYRTVTVLSDFRGEKHGTHPLSGLINVSGALYGTASEGGVHGYGTIVKLDSSGVSLVYAFKGGNDGAFPATNLNAVHKTLYGVTREGGFVHYGTCGGRGCGTVFAIQPSGAETILHRFTGTPDGSVPNARLTEVNGIFYGTTVDGGLYNEGTVYSITMRGVETVLYNFSGGRDGSYPSGRVIHVNGLLYGMTLYGGTYNSGTVFQMKKDGTEKILHSFGGSYEAPSTPAAGLTYLNGVFYGMTTYGGTPSYYSGTNGTIFSMTPTGSVQVLHEFSGSDGADPVAALTAIDGVLYGTTPNGPFSGYEPYVGCGSLFKITTSGAFTQLAQMEPSTGCHSVSPVTVLNGYLVGTASRGGPYHHGTIFELPL